MLLKSLWTYIQRSIQKEPTADWPPVAAAPLVFDVHRATMNGVPLGGSYTQLRQFGRPSNPRPYRARWLGFAPLGLEAHLYDDDRICALTGVFRRSAGSMTGIDWEPDFSPCSMELRLPGNTSVQVTPRTARGDLMPLLGEPQEEEAQDDGACGIGYFYPDLYVRFEFDHEGQLQLLDLEATAP